MPAFASGVIGDDEPDVDGAGGEGAGGERAGGERAPAPRAKRRTKEQPGRTAGGPPQPAAAGPEPEAGPAPTAAREPSAPVTKAVADSGEQPSDEAKARRARTRARKKHGRR